MINNEVFARCGSKTFSAFAHTPFFLSLAGRLTEICRGTANVMDITFEVGHFRQHFRFFEDGFFASDGDCSALMVSDGTEITSTVATADVIDGEFDFFDSGNTAECFIRRMIISFVRKIKNVIEFFCLKRRGRGILNDDLFAVTLDNGFSSYSIVFVLLDAAGTQQGS